MNFKTFCFSLKNKYFRKEAYHQYMECLRYETLPVAERIKESFEKRKKLVEYAYSKCPFYKEYYDKVGFHPDMLQKEEDWVLIPILEKKMIRENAESILSADVVDHKGVGPSETGGSTGKPLVVYKSKRLHYEILGWRALKWYGISPAMNEGIVHRRVPTTPKQKFTNRLIWWPTKRAYLNATRITDDDLRLFVSDLKAKDIKWLVGYCGALELLADYINKNGICVDCVKLVWSTSSPLTDIVRQKLGSAFHCDVMDQYGCCEMGHIAIQKPKEQFLTVNSDYVHVDIVNQSGSPSDNEQIGDVCITDLNTFEFPLIKYRLGDRSRILKKMEQSEDGFPKLAFVKGRITDMLYQPDGAVLDGSFLTTVCDKYHQYISSYQIYQKKDYSIIFYVVPKGKGSDSTIKKIENNLRELVKNKVDIDTKIVEDIKDFAGKRKFIISEIALSKS